MWLIPTGLGLLSVLQAGLNEKLFPKLGLLATVALNSLVLLAFAMCIWMLIKHFPYSVSQELQSPASSNTTWHWWFVVPGVLGYFLVAGIPYSFSIFGAGRTMVLLVSSQILFGLVWGYFYQNLPISGKQLVGAALAIVASMLASAED